MGVGGDADPARHLHDRQRVADVRAQQRIVDLGQRLEQRGAAVVGAADRRCQGRSVEPARARLGVLAQTRRPLECVRGDAVGSATDRPMGGAIEQIGDLAIRADARRGEMPGAGVGVAVARQRAVGAPSFGRRGALVGDRLQQRMREADPLLADDQHAGGLGALEGAGFDPQVATRSDHGRQLAVDRGRGDDDGGAVARTERLEPRFECLEQRRAGDRDMVDRRPAEPLVLAQLGRQLAQSQGVTGRDLEQRVDDARCGLGRRRSQQRAGVVIAQARNVEALEHGGAEQRPVADRPRGRQQRHPRARRAAGRRRRGTRRRVSRATAHRRRPPAAAPRSAARTSRLRKAAQVAKRSPATPGVGPRASAALTALA